MHQLLRRSIIAATLVMLALAACTAGSGTASPAPASPSLPAASPGAEAIVAVTLQEWAVLPVPDSVAAGNVTFEVTNNGPEDVHELVVLRTDLDPGALPADATGAVTEESEGIEVIGEIEDIPVGQTQELTVPLTPGKYVVLCNIYSEDEQEAHYEMGMRTAFTVTE